MPQCTIQRTLITGLRSEIVAVFVKVGPTHGPSARDGLELFLGQLDAFLLHQRLQLFGGLARLGQLAQLGR